MKEAVFTLHPAQQDVFIDQLINAGSPQYNIGGYIILKGILNKMILQAVVNTAPAVFDAFKMRFDTNAAGLTGYISGNDETFKLAEKDFSAEQGAAAAAKKWMQSKMNQPFRLAKSDCLFEQTLLTISPDEHWLFGVFHHLVMDGFGFIIWMQYMADKYRSMLTSESVEFISPSYLEEAALSHTSSSETIVAANDEYWKEKLKYKPTRLFHKKNILAVDEAPASDYSCEVNASQFRQFETVGKAFRASLQQLTIAALLIYFGKTNSAKTFVFGLPVHKRNSRKLRKIVGLFNSFIPFQGVYQDDQTVADLIRSVVASQSADYRHQDFSISNLARHLQINPAEENLFEIIVNYLPFNLELDFGATIQASVFRLVNEYERIPLQICWNIYGTQQPPELQIHFAKEYFTRAEIELFANRLLFILLQFNVNERQKTADIAILPPAELTMIAGFSRSKIPVSFFQEPLPFSDYTVHVLNARGQPVPIGVKGNLCISEKLNGDELLLHEPGFLKTGISAMWAPDGKLLQANESMPEKDGSQKVASKIFPVTITASFVAELLEEYLDYWANEFELNLQISFAPYNQVFQQLLDPAGLFNNGEGTNILLLRVEDWLRDQLDQPADQQIALLQNLSSQFISAAASAQKISSKPCLFGLVPWVMNTGLDEAVLETIEKLRLQISQSLNGHPLFYELDLQEAVTLYDVQDIFDPKSDEAGHISFTDDFYAAVGTYLVRRIRAWKTPAYKVIALDCDNTLWKGICGEVGTMNVIIDTDYQYLQEFLIRKHSEGFLLVLCSKNNEEDVWEVFDHHPQMRLKREHITAHKIDWQPKPANLQAIANELSVGMDSFIFLDDSAFEIEQMERACPGVLSIILPAEPESIPAFLEHTWAFDVFKTTEEDRQRNSMYKAEQQRKEAQGNFSTIADFILTLNVEVIIRQLSEKELERAVQLSMRTNQFNLNGIKKSYEEIVSLINDNQGINWIIEVNDRFGNYGITGLVLAQPVKKELVLNTFLLSCRVLGRNVEDTILTALTKYCIDNGLDSIRGMFHSSGKNKPFTEFLNRTNWIADSQSDSYHYMISYPSEKLPFTPDGKQAV